MSSRIQTVLESFGQDRLHEGNDIVMSNSMLHDFAERCRSESERKTRKACADRLRMCWAGLAPRKDKP